MQEQTETKPALPCSADAASPIRDLPHWKVIPLLILLQLPANIVLLLSYLSFHPHRTLSFLRSGSQQQKRQSRGRRGASAVCVASQYEASSLILPSPQEQHTDSPDDPPSTWQAQQKQDSVLCHEQGILTGSNSQADPGTTHSCMYPKAAEMLPAASKGLHHTSPYPHLLFYPIPWLSSGCWEVLGCRGCCSTVKGIMRQAEGLSALPATHTGTHTTEFVQPAKDSRLHEVLG